MNAEKQRAYRDRKRGRPPRQLAPCGTLAAYRRHQRHNEPIDQPCRDAYNTAQRNYYDARKSRGKDAR